MATAAFKSTSKRGNFTSQNSNSKFSRRRRSLSVSALSRSQSLDIPSEFLNKRDNPLFWNSSSLPPDKEIESNSNSEVAETASKTTALTSSTGHRGRSVMRNSGVGCTKEISRSLSRMDNGRRHQLVARGPYGVSEPSIQIPYWEDGISTGSLSEAEEKTIKAVCEQLKSFRGDQLVGDTAHGLYETVRSEVRCAISDLQNNLECAIQRNNATAIATTNVADIPPDLVNTGAIELVLDIRREYASKLEESQERARKLRTDLAVEEQRGQELSRILKEILPDPKTSTPQRSHLRRRSSSERRKMSKRLTEEAMTYFDECVSLSTFDSSDFSATEDPSLISGGGTNPVGEHASFIQHSPRVSTSYRTNNCPKPKQESDDHGQLMHSCEDFGLTANSSHSKSSIIDQDSQRGDNREWGQIYQFSFGYKPTVNVGLQQDIRSYIKHFEKDNKDDVNSEIILSNYYDTDEYKLQRQTESLLFDRVFFKNRTDSGTLHLCSRGTAIPFSPFASVI